MDLEAGALFRSLGPSSHGATGTRQWTFPFLAKLTLEPWIQLQVGSNGLTAATGRAPQSYFDDVVIGPKFHLLDQTRTTPSISVSAELSVPTFPGQGDLRTFDAFLTAYVTKDLGPVHADFNAACNVWRIDQPLPQALIALALTANVPPPFVVMGEAYFFSNAPPVAPIGMVASCLLSPIRRARGSSSTWVRTSDGSQLRAPTAFSSGWRSSRSSSGVHRRRPRARFCPRSDPRSRRPHPSRLSSSRRGR